MSDSLALALVTQKAMCYAHVSAEIGKFKTGNSKEKSFIKPYFSLVESNGAFSLFLS
jgi:hypothetical protein